MEKKPCATCYQMLSKMTRMTRTDKKFSSTKSILPDQSSCKMKILCSFFVLHTMLSCLNRHLLLNLEDDFWVPVWFEGNALKTAEKLAAISMGSVNIYNQELDIETENESDIEDSEDSECVLSAYEPGDNSEIDYSSINTVLQ